MTTTNYAIVVVLNHEEDRGHQYHYCEIETYNYLDDARQAMKYDAVELYKDANEVMSRHDESAPYHLEVVKLRWSGNYSDVAQSYTKW